MNLKTAEVLAEIKSAVASGQTMIVPSIFTHVFKNRAAVSAAFRIAKRDGIIEINYIVSIRRSTMVQAPTPQSQRQWRKRPPRQSSKTFVTTNQNKNRSN